MFVGPWSMYIKCLWVLLTHVLNNITGRLRDKTGISDTFVVNGEQISEKNLIANHFCSYFTNIGKTYASSIPKSDKLFNSYLGSKPNPSSLYFTPTGPTEIITILKACKAKKKHRWWRNQHDPLKTTMWAMQCATFHDNKHIVGAGHCAQCHETC